jgi:glycosyltransferase involved in cell wall biosynthesis
MADAPLSILFIPRWYPNRTDWQKGIFVKRHAQAVALKHKVAVLYMGADPYMKDKIFELDYLVEEGIPTVRVYYNNSLPAIPLIAPLIKFYRYLRACIKGIKVILEKHGKPDLSHIHVLTRTFFPAFYFKKKFKTPYLITEHWTGYLPEDNSYQGFFKKRITEIAIRSASAVTTVNIGLKDAMLAHGLSSNYSVIPNVVDISMFSINHLDNILSKKILLSVSDFVDRQKNLSGTLRAIQKLSLKRTDFEYHLVGDGENRVMLEKYASELKLLNTFVFFDGRKNANEVAEVMCKADVFILFSNYENMPCVMIEAFASGLPVIGSAMYGMKEHIKAGLGVTVPPGDENALLNAMQHTIQNLGSFDKNYLRQYAVDNFSYEVVGEKFDEIYQKIIKD